MSLSATASPRGHSVTPWFVSSPRYSLGGYWKGGNRSRLQYRQACWAVKPSLLRLLSKGSQAPGADDGSGEEPLEADANDEVKSTARENESMADDTTSTDWDEAWARKAKEIGDGQTKEREARPAFFGRKEIIATKVGEGEYTFKEIPDNEGGFRFGNENEGEARDEIMERELQTVNLATTSKAFGGLFALLFATFCFYVFVYVTGGITNGATRFQNIGMPTYDGPVPLPTPEDTLLDDLSV
ncbi:unnamed protein product [Discosporangium mesarthrocarpum]